MKIIKKEKHTKEVEVTVESYIVCDKCDMKVITTTYDAFEFDFTFKTGRDYPEGGYVDYQVMDLCQKCAEALIGVLRAGGYRVTKSALDY